MPDVMIAELIDLLPQGRVVTSAATIDSYRHDSADFCSAGSPLAVVRPTNTQEVQQVMRWASAHRVPVVPQGARTGRSGAANAIQDCVILSLVDMNRILEVDTTDQVVVVEPGVINAELSRAVQEKGLFYPPDPSSWEQSTIGGNLATNAGGLCCVKYGVTADFVRSLEVVLPSGDIIRTGQRSAKGVAGFDLTRLIVGSEGLLGVITQATLGLIPVPEEALTLAAVFDDPQAAIRAANSILSSGLRPSLMEYLDSVTLQAVQRHRDMGFSSEAKALLLMQSDRGPLAEGDVARMEALCVAAGAVDTARAEDATESEMLLESRRMVGAAVDQLGVTLVEDVTVPRASLSALLSGVEAISADRNVLIATCGHIGDGNMHPTIVFDRGDQDAAKRAEMAFDDIMSLALKLGGTITGEHGVGMLKRSWLSEELGPANLDLQRRIKTSFDPMGILNPGKVLLPRHDDALA